MAVHLRKMMSNKYIHYGSSKFDINRFGKPKNYGAEMWNKPDPHTCLWASPVDSENGWLQWCKDNLFHLDKLESSFIFELTPESKVLNIRNDDELQKAIDSGTLQIRNLYNDLPGFIQDDYYIDFEQLAHDGYDAIEVYIYSSRIYWGLYGWDCDSLLVLNPNCIVEL